MENRTLLASFLVINTVDSGPGSLRQAILDSDADTAGTNTIDFSIPGDGVQTLAPVSPLPAITQSVLIDGFSQPGYAGTLLIELSGSQAGTSNGLTIKGPDVTVRGLDINAFSQGAGIHVTGTGATGNWVYGNFLGTDPTGTQAVPNNTGVQIDGGAANNTIGGTTAGAGNVISANGNSGIWITGAGTTGVVVQQNLIGTDLTGTKPLGNADPGVQIDGGAANNTIGGTTADAGNVISANRDCGIWITGAGTTGVVVQHNLIGTDVTGTKPLGNASSGVAISGGAANTTIGGTTADAGNVISANGGNGIWITDAGTTGVVVQHNFIGTDVTGTKALGNADPGVGIAGGATNTTIGGTTAGAGNVISANGDDGIWITGAGTTGVVVQHNLIGTDVTGTKALGNAYSGVVVNGGAANTTIGGTAADAGNVISANDEGGIWITGTGTTGVVVQHNLIGTDVTGTKALGNPDVGVQIDGGATNTTIGGTAADAGNVISANRQDGIWITGAGTTGVVVEHNLIGTDVTGTKALGNADVGVQIDGGAANTTIGGTAADAGNVISANRKNGIWISGAGTTGVVVQQNLIGTDLTGTKPLGNADPGVQIDGGAANNTIGGTTAGAGNVISANRDCGIWITGAGTTGVVVQHNLIGTDVTGTKPLGNASSGVAISGGAANTTIGGTTADAGNVISANQENGIWISDAGTTGVVVQHNFIGTDVTGTKALGNAYPGVGIAGGATNTTIGGTTADAGNVISANDEAGIWITSAGTTGVVVQHNFIGTDVTGTKALGNADVGVQIDGGAANTTIGGTAADAGNVISANRKNGIWISGAGTTGVVVQHNFIGTDVTGTKALGNAYSGVYICGGATNTTIGGTAADAGNVISANDECGIWIIGAGTTGVVVQHNLIGTDVTGTKPLGNASSGVAISGGAANTTIGGTTADAGNVISANRGNGIWITDAGTTGVVVQHNFIGTDVTGTKPLGNADPGVGIAGGATNTTIGGTAADAGNVISANDESGIWITGAGTTGVVVQHNLIGTDVTGTKALGNAYSGVVINGGAANTTIGGTTADAGNVISANDESGIWITGAETTGVVVQHNLIGTDVTGTKALGNAYSGVVINGGAANTTIGGTTADAGNVISANDECGIWITGGGTTGVVVQHNLIGTDVTGTKALGNADAGVGIGGGAANTTIGGTTADAGNVISANDEGGIWITGAGTTGVVLEQNLIGTDLTGTIALGNANFGVRTDGRAAVSQAGGLTSSDGVFHAFYFPPGTSVVALTLRGNLSGPPQGQSGGGPTAVYRIDVEADGPLLAIVHPQGFSARLMMLDSQGRVLVQSDGLSPSDPDSVIYQDLTPGHYSLVVESTGGAGTYTLTTTLKPPSAPFQPIPAGDAPAAILAGDFTGNGHTDLAVANYGSDDVSILLGNGDGTFQNPVTYAVGSAPTALVAGDFNGDGRTDLAVANHYGNTVSVLLGNGDGTFQDAVTYAVGSYPTALVAGDFNGDGRTDLAVVNEGTYPDYSGSVSVLLGNGDGTFQPQVTYAVGSDPKAIVTGDFTGDRRTDLTVANYGSNDVSVLLGKGDGTFQNQVTYPVGNEPRAIVAGDFTGDGRTDLAVANYGSKDVSILLGNGNGTFQNQVTYAVGTEPIAIVTGDFTGDRRTDLAVANYGSNDVSVLLGKGDGTFQDQMTYPVGNEPRAIVAGDFTGDGRTDLALDYYGSNDVSILLGNGHGTFQNHVLNVVGGSPPAIVAGDFNGDGRTDLAVANYSSDDVSILLGNGDGTFQNQVTYAVGTDPIAIVAGDFNGDGRTDLAVVNEGTYPDYSGSVSILLGNGDGTFQKKGTYAVGTDPIAILAGDFGNGHTDLAVVNELDDDVSVLLGNGDGTFQNPVTYAVGSYPDAIVAGDFGNGHTDLAVANYRSDDVSILLGNGDGTFQDGGTYKVGSYPDAIAAGDFGNGHTDLAVANYGSNDVSILLGNGHGTFFQDHAPYPVGNGPDAIVTGDFNGDGRTDLAVANYDDKKDVSILLGNSDGTFQPQVTSAVGACPDAIVTGDFNGDGRTDLALANIGSNDVSILLGNGDCTFAAPGPFATNPRATPLVADVNGDGTDDVLVVDGAGNILYRQGIPGQPGTFEPPITVNPGTPSRDIAWVPVTNQGPVLASVDATNNGISLYAWRDGKFAPLIQLGPLTTGLLPAQIVTADLNGDGRDDLVVRNAGNGTLTVFFSDGSKGDATGNALFPRR